MAKQTDSDEARAAWIRDALANGKGRGKTQKGLATALGLDQSQGYRIANGKRPLRLAEIPLVERYLEIRAPIGLDEAPTSDGATVTVPVYDLRAAAGAGSLAVDAAPIGRMPFDPLFLRRLQADPSNLFLIEIAGDSGRPTLHHGDHALVDRGQTNPRREGLYVIRIDDVLQVKRLSMNPVTKRLTVKSDNPDYPSHEDVPPDDIAIVGRVIWIGRSLP